MNVRFKPLLILCGFFAVIAVAGAGVWVFGFAGGANDNPEMILAQARNERKAGQFDRALIQYRRALQASGGASADIHEEIASMYAEQEKAATTPQARLDLRISQLRSLVEAAQVDRSRLAPRRQLMQACLAEANEDDAIRWAEELITLDAKDADANYLLARKNLSRKALKLDQARRYLEALAKLEPGSARVDLLTADINRESGETTKNKAIFEKYASLPLPSGSSAAQQLAWARLRLLALADNPTTDGLAKLTAAMEGLMLSEMASVNYRVEFTRELQQIADRLPNAPESEPARLAAFALMEKSLTQAIRENETDLRLKMLLARHLLVSNRLDASVEIAKRGLDSEEAKNPQMHNVVFGLRDVVVKAFLADSKNVGRFEQAQPYIDAMLADKAADVQGVGHLFQGAIDLERSGIGSDAEVVGTAAGLGDKAAAPKTALDYRKSSLDHLKKAVGQLPEVATARALYGVSLILNREPEMGRQALLKAQAMGIPEVRYQVWTAWSQILAGYPEDALPIVNNLLNRAGVEAGVRIFTPTLYLMMGEIHQARNTPESLRKAYEYYATALKLSPDSSNAIHLKVAQLELLLNLREQAEARLKALAGQKETSAAAIQLQVYGLVDAGKLDEAKKLLDALRKQNPESVELLMSDVTIMARESKLDEAVKKLDEFRRRRPEVIEVVQLQVQLMAERLGQMAEARKLIDEHLATHMNSALQSQAAQLALAAGDMEAVNKNIAKLRAQWPDSPAADLVTAQLLLSQNNYPGALASYQAALKKDPNHKLAQFLSAQ
ncbi:MAG: tetratricopeptide repeat protein, partial [Isosphaeraceae bacterium]